MKNRVATHKCDDCGTDYYLNNPMAYKCKCGGWMLNVFDPYFISSEKRKLYSYDIEIEILEE